MYDIEQLPQYEPEEYLPAAQAIFAETELGEERKTITIEFPKEG